ncbi:MAG TPA: ATP synthase F1 subunit delta [Firmicutes bacterium]|jgi:F-type H+-transporting ATPase subunit delta|nr:ATP synthase F1 subunit delta [Bacillota bacterium]
MHSQTALNYGRAIVELAKEKKILDEVLAVTKDLIQELQLDQVQEFLKHPKVPLTAKRQILQYLISKNSVPKEFQNFLNLVIDRRREAFLLPILEAVVDQALKAQGYQVVELISALPLPEEKQKSIGQVLEKVWRTKISLQYRENPNLIGGIIIRRGDELIDGSLSGQLNALKRILISETNIAAELS